MAAKYDRLLIKIRTAYLHGREKYYYCTRHSGASPTGKSASQPKKYLIKKQAAIRSDSLPCRDETGQLCLRT